MSEPLKHKLPNWAIGLLLIIAGIFLSLVIDSIVESSRITKYNQLRIDYMEQRLNNRDHQSDDSTPFMLF